jgi:hypothetical protein
MTKMRIFFEVHGQIKLYSVSYEQLKKSCQSNFIYVIHKFSLWVKWTYQLYLGTDALIAGRWLLVTCCWK